ncbi:hypothetical protein A2U01_0028341, partial [Trifolium medium]|nr:hypothetical protein [Trifolium medium]
MLHEFHTTPQGGRSGYLSTYSWVLGDTRVSELQDKDKALRQLKAHLLGAQSRMKSQADAKRVDRNCGLYPVVAGIGAVAYSDAVRKREGIASVNPIMEH